MGVGCGRKGCELDTGHWKLATGSLVSSLSQNILQLLVSYITNN